jgi:hypothetical protein
MQFARSWMQKNGFLAQLRTAGLFVVFVCQAALGALIASPAVEIALSSVGSEDLRS